ncbi:RNA-directed DNA polymerase, eukaryota, Reverse transcriptase zinc-binding domain protein [Artemisia annua]|uniref:RNA-directed DNA polymerase, eukaryota, Reverse transcriptase zinc-binding domain protein n=1 Tax=Artemisia annua TaxID=35608 RepID=A0A2U1Q7R6_ARTAN|nr:RNA-directed DNA polymerase, eukaryota, Reverse transcriptase zinc-binding domain protein [Artemisia annua]
MKVWKGNIGTSTEEDVEEISNGLAKVMNGVEVNGLGSKIGIWNIRGMGTSDKQKEVVNLINSENLSICAVLETRLKSSKLQKVCDKVFRNWEWDSNMQHCSKGCRIALGWNGDEVQQTLVLKEKNYGIH